MSENRKNAEAHFLIFGLCINWMDGLRCLISGLVVNTSVKNISVPVNHLQSSQSRYVPLEQLSRSGTDMDPVRVQQDSRAVLPTGGDNNFFFLLGKLLC